MALPVADSATRSFDGSQILNKVGGAPPFLRKTGMQAAFLEQQASKRALALATQSPVLHRVDPLVRSQ